jgi:predicted AAA+ superfamily ATPase
MSESLQRNAHQEVKKLLQQFPAVVLVGARQIGKTTLAKSLSKVLDKETIYLDLELPSDLAQLQNPELFLKQHQDKCVILDEVQREKSLFPIIRSLIDQHRVPARFILLGSASPELIRDSSESLAGRVAYYQMYPLSLEEVGTKDESLLWYRGGFPDSFLAVDDDSSILWRQNFIRSYLERDLPLLGLNANAVTLRRLWEILAHQNGQLLNIASIARAIGLSPPTVRHYIDFMEAAFLIHLIKPYHTNGKKRLVKSPIVYVLDTGVLHTLLSIPSYDKLLGHPIVGHSYENFVLNQLFTKVSADQLYFYRTADGTKMDFVITESGRPTISIEVKLSSIPNTTKSFTTAKQDLGTKKNYIVAPVLRGYPLTEDVQVVNVNELMSLL